MCDTYGAPGCKKNIDIEELDRKGKEMMNRELPKPTEKDFVAFKPLVQELVQARAVLSERDLAALKRAHKYHGKRSFLFQIYLHLVETGQVSDSNDDIVRQTLQIKAVKSWSGVCNITIFTAPYPEYTNEIGERVQQSFSCPFNCSFCPTEPGMPKSYLTLEPATLRAAKNQFDCVSQMHDRMSALYLMGHGNLTKLEVNILGGTFTCYPNSYREEFVRDIYYAANIFWDRDAQVVRTRLSLQEEKEINEQARSRVVQVVCELRPDSINAEELKFLRRLSITRLQVGIQHTDNEVLERNNRRCTTHHAIRAIEEAKRVGLKIDGHFMPNMPFSTPEKDRKMLVDDLIGLRKPIKRFLRPGASHRASLLNWVQPGLGDLYQDPDEHWEIYDLVDTQIQVDQLKIYPTAVTVYTDIAKWYKEGSYVPYDETYLVDMLLDFQSMIFPWLRVNRIMRDFYADNIFSKSGSNLALRSELHEILKKEGKFCACIRCREAKQNSINANHVFVIRKYVASKGREYFISAESSDNKILYGFVRLRLDDAQNKIFPELNGAALLREAHVYSHAADWGKKGNCQHQGLGTRLMLKAEKIAREHGYAKMAVIAAVGSRGFYRKLGYELAPGDGEYMVKGCSC